MSEGHVETIIVHDDEDPEQIASEFCTKHHLNDYVYDLLCQQFREKIHSVKRNQKSV